MSVTVRLASTEGEKEAVFQFRYQIYIEEMKRPAKADHQRKMIFDEYDSTAFLFFVDSQEKISATVRTNFRKMGSIEMEQDYMPDMFYPYQPDQISTTSKLMALSGCRNGSTIPTLICYLYEFGIRNSIAVDFINCNAPLLKLYEKIGYRMYREPIEHPEFGMVYPMVMLLEDIQYLERIRSPLYRIAQRLQVSETSQLLTVKEKVPLTRM